MKHSAVNVTNRTLRERTLDALPVTERRLSLNGVSTAVLEGGDGPPILLLHGPSGYAAHWREVIPELTKTNRVIAPDLPGHGASQPFAGVPSPDAALGWIDDLIECTCPTPPVVVGQTLGGALAARFAAERGMRLRAMVLVDALGLSMFQPEPSSQQHCMNFSSRPAKARTIGSGASARFDLSRLQDRLGHRWDALTARRPRLRAGAPGRLAAVSSLMEQFGIPAIPPTTLARIRVPDGTHLGPRRSRGAPLRVASATPARASGGELRVIDNAADDPAIEQPQEFRRRAPERSSASCRRQARLS